RVARESAGRKDEEVRRAYRIVLAREPKPKELEQALAFLDVQSALLCSKALANPDTAALVDFALAMLNRNEFMYVP
ncbi:hypothetical protein ACYOEI_38275, partial [Singulisphaera rosea]